ncbi:hypothetical protein [Methylobacterium sp. WSM2598]|uniref:hypothetical protein n=1 Tax=Methylobacterium sp. WSM2598 TaxID=398261 RepID=UPI0012F6F3BE|nr:hypothetical protein [Methylobacterium sp. WSM2598]
MCCKYGHSTSTVGAPAELSIEDLLTKQHDADENLGAFIEAGLNDLSPGKSLTVGDRKLDLAAPGFFTIR